jgi:hypothetical protein
LFGDNYNKRQKEKESPGVNLIKLFGENLLTLFVSYIFPYHCNKIAYIYKMEILSISCPRANYMIFYDHNMSFCNRLERLSLSGFFQPCLRLVGR